MKRTWENTKKHEKHWDMCQNTDSFLGHGPKESPNMAIFPDALFFTLSLGFVDLFGRQSYPKRPKNAFFGQMSYSKGLIMRWKRS